MDNEECRETIAILEDNLAAERNANAKLVAENNRAHMLLQDHRRKDRLRLAGLAMNGILSDREVDVHWDDIDEFASRCVRVADAVLARLEGEKEARDE